MFEKRIIELSEKFNNKDKKDFFALIYNQSRREVYFQNKKEAINFIKIKFSSPLKKIFYFGIKIGLSRLFLKKMKLSGNFGDVIFVANSIKCFDLKNKIVTSLLNKNSSKNYFLSSTKFREKMGEEGYSPKVFEINEEFPLSKEELLEEYKGEDNVGVFRRLYSWYKKRGIKKIDSNKYINFLKKKLKEKRIKNKFIENTLERLKKKKRELFVSEFHGSFTKEQVLVKDTSYIFVDWSENKEFKEDLLIRDLVTFFRDEENLLEDQKFLKLLKIYPDEIKKDICVYLILNEISSIARRGIYEINLRRIKNTLKQLN